MIRIIFIVAVFCFCSCNTNNENNILHTFPFTLTDHNNISIQVVVNKKDTLNLMFHTAASSVDLTNEATSKINSIHWDSGTAVKTWGGDATSRYSNINTLEIADLKWDSLTIWENENSGPSTDGKFGPNLFAGKVLEINYDNRKINLHKTIPTYAKEYVKLPIALENDMMFIECMSTIEADNFPKRFLIHSGYRGTILYDDRFVAKSKIGERIKIQSEQELTDSHGNILKTKRGEIPLFTIGEFDLENMPVGFFEGAIGRQNMSILGGDILRRFNIIIDSKREHIYVKPSQLINAPYTSI